MLIVILLLSVVKFTNNLCLTCWYVFVCYIMKVQEIFHHLWKSLFHYPLSPHEPRVDACCLVQWRWHGMVQSQYARVMEKVCLSATLVTAQAKKTVNVHKFLRHVQLTRYALTLDIHILIQVYLLTPMDRATLLHVKSTILHCPSSLITRQWASVDIIIAYLNDNAETPLGRFVVYMLYSQLCNKYSDKSNRWSLGLSLSVGGLEYRRCDNQ